MAMAIKFMRLEDGCHCPPCGCAGVYSISPAPICSICNDPGEGETQEWDQTVTATNCTGAANTQGDKFNGKQFLYAIITGTDALRTLDISCPSDPEVPPATGQEHGYWTKVGGGLAGVYVFDAENSSACYSGTPTLTVTLIP